MSIQTHISTTQREFDLEYLPITEADISTAGLLLARKIFRENLLTSDKKRDCHGEILMSHSQNTTKEQVCALRNSWNLIIV